MLNTGANSITFSDDIQNVIKNASKIALKFGSKLLGTEHILYGLSCEKNCQTSKILFKHGASERSLFELFEQSNKVQNLIADVELTPRVKELLKFARTIALEFRHTLITTEHIFLAILSDASCFATKLLASMYNMDINKVKDELMFFINTPILDNKITVEQNNLGETNSTTTSAKNSQSGSTLPDNLLEMGSDLNLRAKEGKLDTIIGRENEIQRLIEILCRKTKNNPIVIGEAGVGKTAVVEGLAQAIVDGNVPDELKDKIIYCLEIGGLMAGTKYRGQMEERLKSAIETIIANENIIVFIDEFHTLMQAGSEKGETNPADMLKPYLSRGDLQTIGATTTDEYRKFIEKDKAMERRLQPVMINPPTVEQTIMILQGIRSSYEEFHKVKIRDDAIVSATILSDRYITDRNLPDKAIDLIDEACSRAKVNYNVKPNNIKDLEKKYDDLVAKRNYATSQKNYDTATTLQYEILKIEEEMKNVYKAMDSSSKEENTGEVGEHEIASIVAKWTGIPVTKITESERERLINLEEILHRRVIGQDEAITAVSKAIRRSRVGLQDNKRPIGSFLFMGPTGVGKTELSKAIAEAMFDNENSIIRLDMSEYLEAHTVSKLLGAPPGYVGFDEGGQLTEQVRRRPYSVVLFDEIEKAHPDVLNSLLQILDDGRVTDGQGRLVNFKNTIIILTSNIGATEDYGKKEENANLTEEELKASRKEKYFESLKQKFKPELINRIDVICIFDSLSKDNLVNIAKILIKNINKRLREKNLRVKITYEALDLIVDKGSNLEYGARPLKRYIQQEVEDKIAEYILLGMLKEQGTIIIDRKGDELNFISEN
ncbi:MAG: ATP-dependent Clp protease ATP-binding subunit [Clostridia bacterium]|nr:ATP-dependent Clp protease ATP-binding subunit [Clostridia bacterium]